MGFKAITIVDPGIKVDPAWDVYQQGLAGGLFLLSADDTPYVGQVWPGAAVKALLAAEAGYWYDARDLSLVVALPDAAGFALEMLYDPTVSDPAPPVSMAFEVTLPPGTPTGTPIHIASSASGWTQQPLQWGPAPGKASGLLSVPRGAWVYYKYTRGDWATVEKWPGCVEATNRYAFGAAHPVKQDTVWQWADACP
jgi:alpha-glucosidase